jgi:hypothetical protein
LDEPAAPPAAAATPPASTPPDAIADQPAETAHQETPAVIDVTDEEEEEDEVMMAIDEYLNEGGAGGGVEPPPPESIAAQPPAPPAASPTPDPFAPLVQPVSADAALSSPPTDKDKVNVSVADMNSSFDSNSGYQASNSDTGNSLFNYSKYGTRSKVGEGELYKETEKHHMSSTYYQCKAARAASMSYQTVNVSLGPDAGTSVSVKHASIGYRNSENLQGI